MQKGYKVIFQGQECVICHNPPSKYLVEKVLTTRNILFILIMNYSDQVSFVTVPCSNDYWLWHFQFGHFHFFGLMLLQQKHMVRGLPPIKEPNSTCEFCILGKKHCESFPKVVAYKVKKPLEMVHINFCGPMRTQSICGSCYFLTFINDFSRKIWVYFLKKKYENFAKFKEFKALVEN